MLGLELILQFSREFSEDARFCVETASDPNNFFFFAVTAIHCTIWTIDFLRKDKFFEMLIDNNANDLVLPMFAELMTRFTDTWREEKRGIMDYNDVVDTFLKH